jgi:glutathione S-transferase
MTHPTLYFSPGACSLAAHVVLEERLEATGAPFDTHPVPIREGAHLRPEYLAVNPRGRVPALRLPDGTVLTELTAVLTYLADSRPEAGLLPPPGDVLRARAYEWMGFLATWVHPSAAVMWRPERYTEEAAAFPGIQAHGRRAFERLLGEVDGLLQGRTWALGERYSVVDAYLLPFYLWGAKERMPVTRLEAYTGLVRRLLARPASQRAVAREGLPLAALFGPPPAPAAQAR